MSVVNRNKRTRKKYILYCLMICHPSIMDCKIQHLVQKSWHHKTLFFLHFFSLICYILHYHFVRTRGSAHWACIAHLTIEWYWSKFQREIILKQLGQMEPNWAVSIYVRSSIKFLHFVPFGLQTWLPRLILFSDVILELRST
jgi:hypothetical protein